MNKTTEQYDIIIVGAGMVGMTLAAALAPSGLKLALLESSGRNLDAHIAAAAELNPDYLRVSALTQASEQILATVGAWQHMPLPLNPYVEMNVWDGSGQGNIQFCAADVQQFYLGHIVENQKVLAGLSQCLSSYDNLSYQANIQINALNKDELSTLVLADGRQLQAKLIVAADGVQSSIRKLAAIPALAWDYQQTALVATVITEKPHQSTAWQRFTETGTLAFLPLDEKSTGNTNSIVWATDPDQARELLVLSDEEFNQALAQVFEGRLGDIKQSYKRHSFPLKQQQVKAYVQSGLALIGDAAHSIHPLAGQGVNLGFLDAAALAEVILSAHAHQQDFSSLAVLKKYQYMRQSNNVAMAAAMEGFKRLFTQASPWVNWLRNRGMDWLDHQGLIKNSVIRQMMGLNQDFSELKQQYSELTKTRSEHQKD